MRVPLILLAVTDRSHDRFVPFSLHGGGRRPGRPRQEGEHGRENVRDQSGSSVDSLTTPLPRERGARRGGCRQPGHCHHREVIDQGIDEHIGQGIDEHIGGMLIGNICHHGERSVAPG